MTTLLTSLALLAGVATAQDIDDFVHDLQCTDTQINMFVRVTPVDDPGPNNILYQDGSIEETHCQGALSPQIAQVNRVELRDQCVFDGLDADLCEDLANDIVDKMVEMSVRSPLDRMALELLDGSNDFGRRARLALEYEDGVDEVWRAFINEEDLAKTPRRRTRFAEIDTRLDCQERTEQFAHALVNDDIGRVQRRDVAVWRCTDDAGELDIHVRFNFKNRAIEEPRND